MVHCPTARIVISKRTEFSISVGPRPSGSQIPRPIRPRSVDVIDRLTAPSSVCWKFGAGGFSLRGFKIITSPTSQEVAVGFFVLVRWWCYWANALALARLRADATQRVANTGPCNLAVPFRDKMQT